MRTEVGIEFLGVSVMMSSFCDDSSSMSHHQHVTLQKHLKVMENRLDKVSCCCCLGANLLHYVVV